MSINQSLVPFRRIVLLCCAGYLILTCQSGCADTSTTSPRLATTTINLAPDPVPTFIEETRRTKVESKSKWHRSHDRRSSYDTPTRVISRIDTANTWTSIPIMLNESFAANCVPDALVNDINQPEIWYFGCTFSNQVGVVRYSLLTNTSEPMLSVEVSSNLAMVYFLNQDPDGRLWLTAQLVSLAFTCGYIAAPLTASPANNSTVTWVPQPSWILKPWFIVSIAAHQDLAYLRIGQTGLPDAPTVVRVNLTDITNVMMVFSQQNCSELVTLMRYDWYLDSFLTVCNGLGVIAIPYQSSLPPYILIPQTQELVVAEVLRVNSAELFLQFLNETQGIMVWSDVNSYEVVMNCDSSCPSIQSWTYSSNTDTILVTCDATGGAGSIVGIQATQGGLSLENAANIQSTILAAACSDESDGPQTAVFEPLSKGFVALCDDGGHLYRGQAISLVVSPPICANILAIQADPSSNMVLVACSGNLLVIDGGASLHDRTFSVCSGGIGGSAILSFTSHRTYSAASISVSLYALCAIQPITHQMMLNNIAPSYQILLEFNSTTTPSLLMADDDLLLIILDYEFVFLNELNNETTTVPIPVSCWNATTVVPMNSFLYMLCFPVNTKLMRLDLTNITGGWVEVLPLDGTCAVAGTISSRPLINQLYVPCQCLLILYSSAMMEKI